MPIFAVGIRSGVRSKINKLTEDHQASHENLLLKNKKDLTHEDKRRLTDALEKMRGAIEMMTQQLAS